MLPASFECMYIKRVNLVTAFIRVEVVVEYDKSSTFFVNIKYTNGKLLGFFYGKKMYT